jgi:DNA-binding transcriptional LysR family regulator
MLRMRILEDDSVLSAGKILLPKKSLADQGKQIQCIVLMLIMRLTQARQVDLNLLVVFVVFAEERNVSRAATRLFLSQPAVSRALQRLRDAFHDDLFVRTPAGYELTPQAQRLMRELEEILPRIDRMLCGPKFDPTTEDAAFRIAVSDSAASALAPYLCRNVVPVAGKLRFEFVQWNDKTFDELLRGSLELAFSADLVESPSPLERQTIYKETFVCVVDPSSRYGKALTIKQYMAAKHISVGIQGGVQVAPDKHLASQGFKREVAMQVPYHEAAVRCVEGTDLIATVPSKFVEKLSRSAGFKVVKAPQEIGGFEYKMIWHPRLSSDSAHTWLRTTMVAIGGKIANPSDKTPLDVARPEVCPLSLKAGGGPGRPKA